MIALFSQKNLLPGSFKVAKYFSTVTAALNTATVEAPKVKAEKVAKAPKVPKVPKVPKDAKAPKATKAAKGPKAPKAAKEPKVYVSCSFEIE